MPPRNAKVTGRDHRGPLASGRRSCWPEGGSCPEARDCVLVRVTVSANLPPGSLAGFPVPCLYAGGPLATCFADKLRASAVAGFAGVCLGRNFFQAADPLVVARDV